MNIGPGPSWGETWRRRGGSVRGGGRDPTTKCRCVLPLRPLRACSASGRTARLPGPLKAPPPPPTVAAEARDAARAGGHVRGRFGLPIKGKIGEYRLVVHRIGKEVTVRCHHCDASVESAQYTLDYCPAWTRPCRDLTVEIEWDLSPPAILETILVSEIGRRVVTSFCEQVMLRKEAAELPPPEDRPARARQRP